MNRFSRLLRALSPACAVFVAGVTTLASGPSASAKTPSFSSPFLSQAASSTHDAFVRVGAPALTSAQKARFAGGFSTLLGSATPDPRGFRLAAAGDNTIAFEDNTVSIGEGDREVALTVTRTGDLTATTTVNYTTVDGTATTPEDYTKASGFLTFNPGVASQPIVVPITDDQLVEPTQSFTVTLTGPTNAPAATTVIANSPATVQITDNESSFSLDQVTQTISEGTRFANVTVRRSGNTTSTTAVDITTSDITANAPADYGAITQRLNFGPNDTSLFVRIPIVDDAVDEDVETFKITLSNPGPSTGILSPSTQTVTIQDNDSTTVSFDRAAYQVDEDAGTLNIDVTRAGDTSKALTVDYRFATGTVTNFSATNGPDFTGINGTLNFAADQTTATISVPINDDTRPENNEQFTVTLLNPALVGNPVAGISPTVVTPSVATVTIVDNDPAVTFEATSYSVNENGGNVVLTVNRTGPIGATASVNYSFVNGTTANFAATNGQDFTGVNGALTFGANQTSQTITVPIRQDVLDENDESFFVTLSNASPSNYQIGPNTFATVTIVDDDATPSVSIADVSQLEPDTGSATQKFTVTLSAISGRDVTVAYATSDGSATGGMTASGAGDNDYVTASGILTIPAGSPSGTINIQLVSDTRFENDEGYIVTISQPSNANIDVRKAVGTIRNDDAAPSFVFTASAAVVLESAGTVTFSVTRTGTSNFASSVTVSTADGSATNGSDYSATTTTLTFAPTDPATKQITVPILEDSINEASETFTATLSNPQSAIIGATPTETFTITDNDAQPTLSLSDARVVEGNSGTANLMFNATLNTNSGQTITVDYATADGTAQAVASGTTGSDYVAQHGKLTFAPGDTDKTIVVAVNGDEEIEAAETLIVGLVNAQNVTLTTQRATGTIINDDTAPTQSDLTFDLSSLSVNEGDHQAVLTVTRTTGDDRSAAIDFATSDGTATNGDDYTATTGTVLFPIGVKSAQIKIPITDDSLQEATENLTVTLSNPGGNAVLPSQNTATITIVDNEGAPSLSVANTGVDEGDSGRSSLLFTVSLQPQSQSTVTVDIATLTTGTAVSSGKGQDFLPRTGTLTFAPGVATQTFAVPVIGDGIVEGNDTVNVALSNAQGAPIGQSTATGTILNDDQPGGGGTITFLSSSYSVNESAGSATITLGRSGNIDLINQQSATVRVATGSGTATPGSDYRPVNTILTFAPGQTTKSFVVPILNNTVFENDENVSMSLSDPSSNAILGATTSAMLTIVDDDQRSTAPRAETLSPTASVGSPFTVTTTYSSDLGASDLTQVLIQVGGNQGGGGLRAIYNPKTNRLSLDPSTGSSATPRSRTVLANQFGSLDCSQTTVERSGNTLRVTWRLRPTAATPQYVALGATASNGSTVFVRRGTWRPSTSASPSGSAGGS